MKRDSNSLSQATERGQAQDQAIQTQGLPLETHFNLLTGPKPLKTVPSMGDQEGSFYLEATPFCPWLTKTRGYAAVQRTFVSSSKVPFCPFLFSDFICFYFMCFACIYVSAPCRCQMGPEEGSSGTGVTDGYEPPCWCCESNQGPLEEH